MKKRSIFLLIVLLVFLILFTGCSSDESSISSAPIAPGATSAPEIYSPGTVSRIIDPLADNPSDYSE